MPRSTPEWEGKTDDEQFPPRVRLRILERYDRRCASCGRGIAPGERWTCDHILALVLGGRNKEGNGQPLCGLCTKAKDASDVAVKSKIAQVAKSAYGLKKPKRPMAGSKASGWRKKMDGSVVRR